MVVLHLRGGVDRRACAPQQLRRRRSGDVEQRDLRAATARRRAGVLADSEQQAVADRMQVGGVALDLSSPARAARPGREIDRVQRVDLPEGHHVAACVDEAHGVDALALAEAADAAELLERAAALTRAW